MDKIKAIAKLCRLDKPFFCLPFCVTAAFLADEKMPDLKLVICILFAVFFGLSAGNVFNAICDRKIDKVNPRTKDRPLASGAITKKEAFVIFGFCMLMLFVFTAMISVWYVLLLPIPASLFLFYSLSKRYTWLCHAILAVCEAASPVASGIVIMKGFRLSTLLLGAVVFLWSLGFELIYSTQDVEYDKKEHMNSFPVRFGVHVSFCLSAVVHLMMLAVLAVFIWYTKAGTCFTVGCAAGAVVIAAEHWMVRNDQVCNAGKAFEINQIFSIILMITAILDKTVMLTI